MIAVAPNKFADGFDGTSDDIPVCYEVRDIVEALRKTYSTDAHMVAYVVDGVTKQPRIRKKGLPFFPASVLLHCLIADCDNAGHGDWTPETRAAARAQEAACPLLETCGIYDSEHGRRFVQPLEIPIPVAEAEPYLLRWLDSLAAAGVPIDPCCKDWTRHFRMPHVFRMGAPFRSPYVNLEHMRPITLPPLPTPVAKPPPVRNPSRPRNDFLLERARRYIDKVPPAVEGQCGDLATFKLCANLTRGFDLSDSEVFDLLHEWNAACSPPWDEDDLYSKIEAGRSYGLCAIGSLRDVPPHPSQATTAHDVREPGSDDDNEDPPAPIPPPQELEQDWQPVPLEWLEQAPPEREYLLTWHDKTLNQDVGALPRGIAAMLAGAGGSGKSFIAIQLAVAVATGMDWFGFKVAKAGRVLIILGEEDKGETRRRIYYACRSLHLDKEQRQIVHRNVVVMAMAGKNVAITRELKPGESGLPTTPWESELKGRLERESDWALIVLDPLSRFAGPDVEIDNSAATRFVQTVEQFANLPTRPTVLICHHTGKLSRREGHSESTPAAAASAARGSSALTDGVRWVATLEVQKRVDGAPELSILRIAKSNYGMAPPDTHLVSDPEQHGIRIVADSVNVAKYASAADESKSARADDKRAREHANLIVRCVKILDDVAPQVLAIDTIRARAGKGKPVVTLALADAYDNGQINRQMVGGRPYGYFSKRQTAPIGLIGPASDSHRTQSGEVIGPDSPTIGSPSPVASGLRNDGHRTGKGKNGNGCNGDLTSSPPPAAPSLQLQILNTPDRAAPEDESED